MALEPNDSENDAGDENDKGGQLVVVNNVVFIPLPCVGWKSSLDAGRKNVATWNEESLRSSAEYRAAPFGGAVSDSCPMPSGVGIKSHGKYETACIGWTTVQCQQCCPDCFDTSNNKENIVFADKFTATIKLYWLLLVLLETQTRHRSLIPPLHHTVTT